MISDIDWDRLFAFLGYGPRHTPEVLFFGLEEKNRDGDRNLRARSSFEEIEDLFDAHQNKLGPAGCSNPFAAYGNPVKPWNAAARFILCLAGDRDWQKKWNWSRYWRERLGRRDGTTFLMESCPIPRESRATLIAGYPKYTDETAWQKRREVLARYFASHKPATIIAYGKGTRAKLEELLHIDSSAWQPVDRVSHPARVVLVGPTRVAHVGFFGQGCFKMTDIPAIVQAIEAL